MPKFVPWPNNWQYQKGALQAKPDCAEVLQGNCLQFNVWMSLSNVMVIFTLLRTTFTIHFNISLCTALASFLMHLSERKHDLPGIYPLNQYANVFLNLDRIMAMIGIVYMLSFFWYRMDVIILGVIGLLFMTISKNYRMQQYYNLSCVIRFGIKIVYYLLYITSFNQ